MIFGARNSYSQVKLCYYNVIDITVTSVFFLSNFILVIPIYSLIPAQTSNFIYIYTCYNG